jgi:hypothetical protein
MRDSQVVTFPGHARPYSDFESWLSWVECEIAILGHEFEEFRAKFNWREAFDLGLSPEATAQRATGQAAAS